MEPHVDNFSNSHVQGFHLSSNKFNNILAVWHYMTTTNRSEWINALENTDACGSTWFVMADQRWLWVGSASSCTPVLLHFHLLYRAWMRLFFSWSNLVIFHSNHTQGWSRSFFIDLGRAWWVSFRRARVYQSKIDRNTHTHTHMMAHTNTPYTSLLHLWVEGHLFCIPLSHTVIHTT